jgi:hypothetical protein
MATATTAIGVRPITAMLFPTRLVCSIAEGVRMSAVARKSTDSRPRSTPPHCGLAGQSVGGTSRTSCTCLSELASAQ